MRAFVFFGDFLWPPVAVLEDELGVTRKGVIEIHVREKAEKPLNTAVAMRWRPFRPDGPPRLAGEDEFEWPTVNLFQLEPDQAKQRFADLPDGDELAFLIDQKGIDDVELKNETKPWLSFRGGFLLDQYETAESALGGVRRTLRWPLVRKCAYAHDGNKKEIFVHSTFGVGLVGGKDKKLPPKAYFRFNLHLPLPLSRTTQKGQINAMAFPFAADFHPQETIDKTLNLSSLVGGWVGFGDAAENQLGKSFKFENVGKLPERRLGAFGFAAVAGKDEGAGRFAGYTGNKMKIEGKPDKLIEISDYWPTDDSAIHQDLLARFGFLVTTKWEPLGPESPQDLSLRFRQKDENSGAYVYRVGIVPETAHDDTKLDLSGGGSVWRLRLNEEAGGTVVFEKHTDGKNKLAVDAELSWSISDEDIWSDDPTRDWSPRVRLVLHSEFNRWRGLEEADSSLSQGLLSNGKATLNAARSALHELEGGDPRSFLPEIEAEDIKGSYRRVRLAVYSPRLPLMVDPNGMVGWDTPSRRVRLRMTLVDPNDLILAELPAGNPKNTLLLTASKMSFFDTPDVVAKLQLESDQGWIPETSEEILQGEPYFASYKIKVTDVILSKGAKGWTGRLGGLQFWGRRTDGMEQPGHLRLGGPGSDYQSVFGAPAVTEPNFRIAAQLRLQLDITSMSDVGAPVARGDRTGRRGPVVIPDPLSDWDGHGKYFLSVTESLSPTADRLLEAEIFAPSPSTAYQTYTVLNEAPFSIFRFTRLPIDARGDASTVAVGVYSSEDRVFQYRQVSDQYHYVLPPQVIGESADKPGRLEIHDSEQEVPYLSFEDTPLRQHAVQFRLTPPAEIWIRPSDVERGYFLPEAMTYELFRQAGGLGFGTSLAFLRAEFLYGLPVGISTKAERGPARAARVAEIEALTGRIRGPVSSEAIRGSDLDRRLGRRWEAISDAVARRPERLEIWEPGAGDGVAFPSARFTDGVSFSLRRTALLRKPVLGPDGSEAPQPGTGVDSITGLPVRYHPQGLAGGVLWPVEQEALLRELEANPRSNGGAIERIALSPFGGDAAQKARFLNGIVTIQSETRNGHVERHKVEVLGRIRAFWHRARHVVVYERTVSPSAQFTPKDDGPPDGSRSRRPILRKVSEYIELLEPERSYPDSPFGQVRSAGFLRKVRFNTTLIPVDSAWAREVVSADGSKSSAWTIPLWNRHAARERPQVYAMPDIAFVTAGEGEGEQPETIQQCLEPDLFDFFADFAEKTDQTDLWPSKTGIDFPAILPGGDLIKALDKVDEEGQSSDPAKRRPGVSRILPGLRRFTWRLAPAAQKTMINAGRSDQPVYVGLESVTFMRGGGVPLEGEVSAAFAEVAKAAKDVGEFKGSEAFWAADGDEVPEGGADFVSSIKVLVESLRKGEKGFAEVALNGLKAAFPNLANSTLGISLNVKAEGAKAALSKFLPKANDKRLTDSLSTISRPCDALKADAVSAIRAKRMLIGTAIADWVNSADGLVALLELAGKVWTKGELSKAIVAEVEEKVTPFFDQATRDVTRLREGMEKARAIIGTVGDDAEAVIARGRARVQEVHAAYDRAKPWSPQRLNGLQGDLDAAILGLAQDVGVAVDEARQRLAVELGAAGQSAAGHVAIALEGVTKKAKYAIGGMDSAKSAFDKAAADFLGRLEILASENGPGKLADAKTKLDVAKGKIAKLPADKQAAVRKALAGATSLLDGAIDSVVAARAALNIAKDKVDLSADKISAAIDTASASLNAIIGDAGRAANEVLGVVGDLADDMADGIKGDVNVLAGDLQAQVSSFRTWLGDSLSAHGKFADALVQTTAEGLKEVLDNIGAALTPVREVLDMVGSDATKAVGKIEALFAPDKMAGFVVKEIVRPIVEILLKPLPENIDASYFEQVRRQMANLSAEVTQGLSRAEATILSGLEDLLQLCGVVFDTVEDVKKKLEDLEADAVGWVKDKLEELPYQDTIAKLEGVLEDAQEFQKQAEALADKFGDIEDSVRALHNDILKTVQDAKAYGDRVLDLAANLGKGGLSAAPSNVLKLYSAVTSPPEIAALKSNLDKMRAEFDEFEALIKTTPAAALFGKLGDALKGMEIALPFDGIADRMTPPDLSGFDVSKVFAGFGGAKLKNLLKGAKLPKGVQESVRLTHGFDKKAARAWVQIDIDANMPGRKSLFTVGPFKTDFLNMRLMGQVRFEVSKDTPEISETGYGRIETTIDMGVSGQSIVKFENFALAFSRESGLDVQFDPKGIRLNPQFRMIQEFMETLFPDEVGGIEILKQDNIPVGLKHVFMMPPIGANAVTSGVSNISIGNTFALRAYPDFELSDTFNLASEERPFIFSIFILGCTGYMEAGVSYLPIDNKLAVTMVAAIGGSAQLAIDIGPFNGAVYITLSGVLTYRKVANQSGGALTIGMTLVIAGSVRVMGMVTVMISVVLRLSYKENGQIDANGTLSVTIRISRFFKIRARASVSYTLKDGRSQTTTSLSAQPTGELAEKAKKAQETLDKLKKVTAGGMK